MDPSARFLRRETVWLAAFFTAIQFFGEGACVAEDKYKPAPKSIARILDAPLPPRVSLSPSRDRLLFVQGVRFLSVEELSQPMLKLAGVRINPLNFGPAQPVYYVGLRIKDIASGTERAVALPQGRKIGFPIWSPDGQRFAFLMFRSSTIDLWICEAKNGELKQISGVQINASFGKPFEWLPDSQSIICQTVLPNAKTPPKLTAIPVGPVVQEAGPKIAPVRTFQDLLTSHSDEQLFDHYAMAQLDLISISSGKRVRMGRPAIFYNYDAAPDGRYLLVERIHRPYSYQVPAQYFPRSIEIWDREAKVERVTIQPSTEGMATGAVPVQPRAFHWRPTLPVKIVWVEALDGGNPDVDATHRDRVMQLQAPFQGKPQEVIRLEHRYSELMWSEDTQIALVREFLSHRSWYRTWLFNPDRPEQPGRLLWDHSAQERNNHPGNPLNRDLSSGHRAMRIHGRSIYLNGQSLSSNGERPFLDRLDLDTFSTVRLFESDPAEVESVVALVKDDASEFITRHENPSQPPNYQLRKSGSAVPKSLTRFPDADPILREVKKQLITYRRSDGVMLSSILYLPPDHTPGKPLPTILWAYPREYAQANVAGQVVGSSQLFANITGTSHLFFALEGYAVLDRVAMPIVGDADTANDTFVEQIVSSAEAAINKLVEMGVADPNRLGVGGHSYGAFMAVNLLANSGLFRAGIARSGAYNRTLTPFGFQNERRTLWQAPETYFKMSPILAAPRIKEPLLLIHGEDDNNAGTPLQQSERLYQAVRGTGGTARLVVLPHESHNYRARESVGHTLHEMVAWFDKYVKNAPPASIKN